MGNDSLKYPFLDLGAVNAPHLDRIRRASDRVISSGYFIGGPEVEALERDMAALVGAKHVIAVSNGLDALRLIFRSYIEMGEMSPGDEVIIPADTYIASVLAVTDCGLVPVFVDASIDTLNLDTSLIGRAITSRTRAILTVHLYGRICYDETMVGLARRHNLKIVEDAAQSIGAVAPDGRRAGALGDAAGFSFYPTKNLGALGDAGAVTTSDDRLAATVRALANYGSDRRYHNIYQGLNCRMDPVQAAILCAKMPFLADENAHRARIAAIYDREIVNPAIRKPLYTGEGEMVWHQYPVLVSGRDRFREYLHRSGVGSGVHYPIPPHKQPCYSEYAGLSLPVAERIAREVVSLPISSATPEQGAHEIARIINNFD